MFRSRIIHFARDYRRRYGTQGLDDRNRSLSLNKPEASTVNGNLNTNLDQSFQRGNSALQNRVKNEVRLHDAHRFEAALDVRYGCRILREHCEKGNSSQALYELASHLLG